MGSVTDRNPHCTHCVRAWGRTLLRHTQNTTSTFPSINTAEASKVYPTLKKGKDIEPRSRRGKNAPIHLQVKGPWLYMAWTAWLLISSDELYPATGYTELGRELGAGSGKPSFDQRLRLFLPSP